MMLISLQEEVNYPQLAIQNFEKILINQIVVRLGKK